jgi:hypothetical protein
MPQPPPHPIPNYCAADAPGYYETHQDPSVGQAVSVQYQGGSADPDT